MDFVTGGTGFIGAHVVRAPLRRGRSVRCLVRASSRLDNLEELPVEVVAGDVTDRASLSRAMAGARWVFHCAADYRLSARRPGEIYAANVAGTENVLAAAAEVGAERVVYTSSVGALGLPGTAGPATRRRRSSPVPSSGTTRRASTRRKASLWNGPAEGCRS
mgnify:CR=1 FL=1